MRTFIFESTIQTVSVSLVAPYSVLKMEQLKISFVRILDLKIGDPVEWFSYFIVRIRWHIFYLKFAVHLFGDYPIHLVDLFYSDLSIPLIDDRYYL